MSHVAIKTVITSAATGDAVEQAIIDYIAAQVAPAGWTVVVTAGQTYFLSVGEDSCSRIVGGLETTGTRQIRALNCADLDQDAIVAGSVLGYTNNDAAGVGSPVQNPTNSAAWTSRLAATDVQLSLHADLDSISLLASYTSTSGSGQMAIYIGKVRGRGDWIERWGRAKILSVGPGSDANHRLFTLDRNINLVLKNGAVFAGDLSPVSQLFYQTVSGPGMLLGEFGLTQMQDLASNLVAPNPVIGVDGSGRTTYEADVTGVKLFAPGGRYASNRGAGDLVRLHPDPTICAAGAGTNAAQFSGTNQAILASWDGQGGQGTGIDVYWDNLRSDDALLHDVSPSNNLATTYSIRCVLRDYRDGLIGQPKKEGERDVGTLIGFCCYPGSSVANFATLRKDGDPSDTYSVLKQTGVTGLRAPGGFPPTTVGYAHGPGF